MIDHVVEAGRSELDGNSVAVFNEGDAPFAAMLTDIAAASERVSHRLPR